MSGTLSRESSDVQLDGRGRVRRCKHCKFSCTNAKEFFHHQMMEHEEENDQIYATPNKALSKVTQNRKKNTQSSQEERIEDILTSDKPNGDTIIINNMVTDDEEADEDGRLVIADQNEDGNNSESTVVTPTRCGNIQNRTYVCSGCDFSSTSAKVFLNHQKDEHRFDIIIYECDICEYATKYKQKLPRHRKLHFSGQDLLVGEGMPGEMDEFSNNEFQNDESIDNLPEEDELPEDSFKDLPPLIDSNTVIVNPTDPDDIHIVPEIKKAKKRQEVDPAKYFEVVDDTGCKYACSSCGNVYKWRKSLNKHWKEKHGGEMPDNSRKPPGLVYLVNSGGHTICGRRKILANSVLNKSQNGSIPLCDTRNSSPSRTPLSIAPAEIMISMSDYTSSTNSQITSAIPSFIGPFVTNSLQPVYPETSTPNMMDKNQALKAKSQYTSRIRLQGQNEPLDFSVRKDDEALMQSSYMHIKSEPEWETEDPSKVDDKSKSVLQCTKCSFVAKTLVDYSSHMTLHLNKRAFKCAECQEHFNGVDDLNLHFAEVHANRIQEHKEAIQRIPHGLQQTYHLLKMPLNAITSLNSQDLTTSDSKKLKCNMCSFVAKWPAELQKHAVSHSEERPFMCMVCGSTYKWKWDLVKHFEKSHHTLPNPYKRREMNLNKNASSPSFSISKGNISLDDETLLYKNSQEDQPSKKRRLSDSDMDDFDRMEDDENRNSLSHLTDLNIDVNGLANIGRSMGLASNRPLSLPKLSDIEMDEDNCSRLQISNIYSLQERESLLGKRPINETTQRAVAAAVLNRLNMNNISTNDPQMGGMTDDSSVLLPYKCQRCEYRARWPSEITQHMKNHSEDKPYLCPRCSYRSKWKWDVVKHLKRCGGGGTIRDVIDTTKIRKTAPPNVMVMPEGRLHQQTPQPNCHNYQRFSEANLMNDSALASMAKMTMEKQDKSANNQPRKTVFRSLINDGLYYCLECQFVGTSPAELKRHAVLHSENKPFMCEICGYSSRWKCDLKKHMRTYNHYTSAAQMLESQASDLNASSDMEDSEYQCEKCYFSTDQQHLYKAHLQVHEASNSSGNNSGRFKCKQCSFQVNDLASFLQHRVTHNNSRQSSPAPSQNSPAASHTSESPKTDMDEARIKHPRKQIKTFHCSKCDFVCKRRDLLETHEMEHVGEDSLFKCVYCDASYKDKDSLLDHISTHSDFNPDEWETFFMEEDLEENNNEIIESLQQMKKSEHSISTDTPRLASALAAGPKYMNKYQNDESPSPPQKLSGGIIVPAVRKFTCEWCDATFGHVTTLYHHGKNVHPIELSTQEMAESARDFLVTNTNIKPVKPETKQLPPQYDAALFGGNHYLVNPSLMTTQVLSQVSAVHKTRPILPNNLDPMKFRKSTSPPKKAKSFQCTKCPFTAPNAVTYLRHIERHGSNCKHTCWFCDYSIDRLNLLYQHMKGTHTDQWRKTATTGDVSPKPEIKEFSPVNNASEDGNTDPSNSSHLQIKEEIMLKGVPVQICSYDGKRVFKCKKCSYISSNAANTTNHARQHAMNYSNIEEKVETVQAMTNLVKALRAQKEKKKSAPGQTQCTKCPFKSLVADNIEKHIACHDYDGMYRCEQCDFSTDQVIVLTQHMQLHENNQPMKPQSSKSFIPLTSTYNRIVLNRKPLTKKDSASKLLSIQARTSLNKSRRIRYKCSRCPYNSFCKNNMIKHRRQHIVKSRFRCPICNYSATRDYLLFQHMKFHGGDTDQMIKELKDKTFDDVVMDPFEKNGESPESNHRQDEDKDQSLESYDAEKQNDVDNKTSIHQCQGCPYSTEVEIEYQKHIKLHFSKNLYRCDYCSFNVASLTPLLDHRMLHSKEDYFDDNPPLANLMNKSISDGVTSTSFNQHQDSSQPGKDEMRYTCQLCPYKCNSIKSYSVHKSMHGVNKKFICDFCNWSVDRLNLLYQHRRVHSKEPGFESNPEEILFMNREYALGSSMKDPEDALELENSVKDEILYSCSDCPFTTANKNSFINHKALHESPARHKCSECSYSVDKYTLMCQHKKLHEESKSSTSPLKKRLKCSKCPYHSQNRQLLENHMKMHASGHKYNCGLCDYSTDQLNLLQQHVKVHNDSTNIKPSKSPHSSSVQVIEPGTSKITCPQLYFSSTNDEIQSDGSEEELKCDRCPFSTPSKQQLDDHEHRHNFKNRVSCPYCDFSSMTDSQILEHIQVHFPGTPKEALKLMLERRQKEPNNNTDADDKMALTVTKKVLKLENEPDSTVSESQKSRPEDEKTEKTEESVESEELENSKSTTKVYVCQYCEREFDNKSNMIQHERQHLIGHQY